MITKSFGTKTVSKLFVIMSCFASGWADYGYRAVGVVHAVGAYRA
jgi:hypothetical protein